MAIPWTIALPPDHVLTGSYTVRITAIDAATGATVSGVNVSNVTLQVENLGPTPDSALAVGPFMLVPGPGSMV